MGSLWAARCGYRWLAATGMIAAFYAKFALAPAVALYGIFAYRRSPQLGLAIVILSLSAGVVLFVPFWEGPETLDGPLSTVVGPSVRTCNSFVAVAWQAASFAGDGRARWVLSAWSWPCKIAFLVLAMRLARAATSVKRVISGSLLFLFLYECLGMSWFWPWYVTWLVPLAFASRDPRWLRVVAVYSTTAPLVVIPVVGIAAAHGVPLLMAWRYKLLTTGAGSPRAAWLAEPEPVRRPLRAA
jgi:hypothetical protein